MRFPKKLKLQDTEKHALEEIITYLRGKWPQVIVKLFGSKVMGSTDPESDIDLFIELPVEVDDELRKEIVHKTFYVNLSYDSNIDVLIVSQDDWENSLLRLLPIHAFIEKEGVDL